MHYAVYAWIPNGIIGKDAAWLGSYLFMKYSVLDENAGKYENGFLCLQLNE